MKPDIFIPGDFSFLQVASTLTHLGIGAHQDDLEMMALPGILECYRHSTKNFGGIVCTNGSGSPRKGRYRDYDDKAMIACRREEQQGAALLGDYSLLISLNYPSSSLKQNSSLAEVLYEQLLAMHPSIIYTHHPLDKHPTHRAVFYAVIEALRRLPRQQRPHQLLGSEVWRGLDWVTDEDKIALDVSAHPELSQKLLSVFDSQIAGGKRYDLAAEGRRRANATFATPHTTDQAALVSYAIDLTPLVYDTELDVMEYALGFVDRFRKQVEQELSYDGCNTRAYSLKL